MQVRTLHVRMYPFTELLRDLLRLLYAVCLTYPLCVYARSYNVCFLNMFAAVVSYELCSNWLGTCFRVAHCTSQAEKGTCYKLLLDFNNTAVVKKQPVEPGLNEPTATSKPSAFLIPTMHTKFGYKRTDTNCNTAI